eukprot:ANDGO_05595.mRNA.1 hypothetical protein
MSERGAPDIWRVLRRIEESVERLVSNYSTIDSRLERLERKVVDVYDIVEENSIRRDGSNFLLPVSTPSINAYDYALPDGNSDPISLPVRSSLSIFPSVSKLSQLQNADSEGVGVEAPPAKVPRPGSSVEAQDLSQADDSVAVIADRKTPIDDVASAGQKIVEALYKKFRPSPLDWKNEVKAFLETNVGAPPKLFKDQVMEQMRQAFPDEFSKLDSILVLEEMTIPLPSGSQHETKTYMKLSAMLAEKIRNTFKYYSRDAAKEIRPFREIVEVVKPEESESLKSKNAKVLRGPQWDAIVLTGEMMHDEVTLRMIRERPHELGFSIANSIMRKTVDVRELLCLWSMIHNVLDRPDSEGDWVSEAKMKFAKGVKSVDKIFCCRNAIVAVFLASFQLIGMSFADVRLLCARSCLLLVLRSIFSGRGSRENCVKVLQAVFASEREMLSLLGSPSEPEKMLKSYISFFKKGAMLRPASLNTIILCGLQLLADILIQHLTDLSEAQAKSEGPHSLKKRGTNETSLVATPSDVSRWTAKYRSACKALSFVLRGNDGLIGATGVLHSLSIEKAAASGDDENLMTYAVGASLFRFSRQNVFTDKQYPEWVTQSMETGQLLIILISLSKDGLFSFISDWMPPGVSSSKDLRRTIFGEASANDVDDLSLFPLMRQWLMLT